MDLVKKSNASLIKSCFKKKSIGLRCDVIIPQLLNTRILCDDNLNVIVFAVVI